MKLLTIRILLYSFFFLSFTAIGKNVDSLKSSILWLKEQDEIGQEILKKNQDFDEAVNVFKNAHDFILSQNINDDIAIDIAIGYGIALYKNGNIQNSYSILSEVLPKLDESDGKLLAEVNQMLGMTLVFKNKFPEAYKYQMDALTYFVEANDTLGVMNVHFDLGSNFGTQGQSELALKHYEEGIALAKLIGDEKLIILGNTALGNTYTSLKDFEKALEYIEESIELAKKIKDDEELGWASINYGHVLGLLGRNNEAHFYLKQAYDLSFVIGNKLLTAYSLEQISDIYLYQNQMEDALSALDESYVIFQELGQTNSIKSTVKKYAEIYFKQNEFQKYKEYTDMYISLKDSLFSNEMMEAMANLKQDFEIQKIERENQIALLTKDRELTKANSIITMSVTGGAVIIALLFLILMYHRSKSTFEKNAILEAKNAEIIRQNQILADSNRDLEKFAYIISHDLKEPLRNINGFTKLLIKDIRKYNVENRIFEYGKFITNGTQQMSDLLNGLLDYSKIGVNKSEKELVDLNDIVWQVKDSLKIQLDEKNCQVEIDNLPKVSCRPAQLTQVFQNLIANALKFGYPEGNKIRIGVKENDAHFQICVSDQGIGIDQEYQKDIFVVFKRLHNRGTYSGSGIGLATCKKVVEEHGGEIWVESEEGKGACFFFTIPKVPTKDIESPNHNSSQTTESLMEMV